MEINLFYWYSKINNSNTEALGSARYYIRGRMRKAPAFQMEVETDEVRVYDLASIIKDLHLCWRVSNWYEGVVVISVGVNEQEIDKLETT